MHRRAPGDPRCWLDNSAVVFPVAALLAALTALATGEITTVLVALLAVAMVPWAFLAGGIAVPDWAMTVGVVTPTVVAILHCQNVGPEFNILLLVVWLTSRSRSVTLPGLATLAGTAAAWRLDRLMSADHVKMRQWILFGAGMAFAWFVGALLRRERTLVDQLERANTLLDDAAAAEERRRVAREIHDIVGHSLTVVLLNVAGARRLVRSDPDAATDALSQAEQLGRESLEQMREAVGLLRGGDRPDDDTNAGRAPLPNATDVAALVERSRTAGLAVDLHVDGDLASLDAATGLSVFRVVQEALTNAGRHAPGAPVEVHVVAASDRVRVRVRNRRAAVTTPAAGHGTGTGLLGMRERVGAVGGTFTAGPGPDGGWSVDAELPTRAAASEPVR